MRKIISVLCLLLCGGLYGQYGQIQQKSYSKKDGLEIDKIHGMALDNDGFLWIAGEDFDVREILNSEKKLQIQRFNGRYFHNIDLPDVGSRILNVFELYKREDGKFYIKILAEKGVHLYLFDPFTTQYTKVKFSVMGFLDALGGVFYYNEMYFVLSQKNRTVKLNVINEDSTTEELFSFERDENKYLLDESTVVLPFKDYMFIGDDNFPLFAISWKGDILKEFPSALFSRAKIANTYKPYIDEYFYANGTYYLMFFKNPNLFKVDEKRIEIKPVLSANSVLENEHLRAFTDKNNQTVVSRTYHDTLSFSRLVGENLEPFFDPVNTSLSGSMNMVSNDINEEVWMSLGNGQIHHFKFSDNKVEQYLENESIRYLMDLTEEKVLIATEGQGWFTLDKTLKKIQPYEIIENGKPLRPYSTRNIIRDGERLWSNDGGNVIEVDVKSQEAKAYRHYPVACMEGHTDSTLVYGTFGYNLMQFNTRTKEHTAIVATDSIDIIDIAIKDNILVGATNKGVLIYDFASKKQQMIQDILEVSDNYFLMTDYIEDVGFVLGSRDGKILKVNVEENAFEVIYEDELKTGIATIVIKDDVWWINTFKGLVAYNPETNSKQRYTVLDGFSNDEGNRYSALQTNEGLFFGTIEGLNFFDPNQIKPQIINSKLVQLRYKGYSESNKGTIESYNRELLSNTEEVTLSALRKDFEIDVALTDAIAKTNYLINYRLDNLDWNTLGSNENIKFANLAPGKYNLEVEALNLSGKTIGEPLKIKINSENFFYKTWWFYLLVTLGVTLFLLYLLRESQFKKQRQQKFSQQLIASQEEERTRIARELHDSVGQQLTMIKKHAHKQGDDSIAQMTNNALEEVRAISRNLYPSILKQLGLTESIELLIYDVEQETSLLVYSEIDNIDTHFSNGEALNIYRFIQECVSNVLRHSSSETLSIKLEKQSKSITITIVDSGQGFDMAKKGILQSLGMRTMTERIRILDGEINIQSKANFGTTIRVTIPIVHD